MLRIHGQLRPDVLMRHAGVTIPPAVQLEINGPDAWLLISTSFVLIRLPAYPVRDSNVDIPGPMGAVFDTLKSMAYKQREFFIQCDTNNVEFYDEMKHPVARVARGTHRDEYTTRMRSIQHPAYEYPLVVGVKPAQLAQAARAMGEPGIVYLHLKPEDGSVREAMRVSSKPFGPDSDPHGYIQPVHTPQVLLRKWLEPHVSTAEIAAKVKITHPWYDPVRPVEPVVPIGG